MNYDLVVIGGGLAGSALGTALARHGARVLIIEKEASFRDRVRGEGMLPWGAAEARSLGIHQRLVDSCGRDIQWWISPQAQRDLRGTSPSGLGCLNFHHPEMQQCLLELATECGCDVLRPADVVGVIPGEEPIVVVRSGQTQLQITARLVVGADGRNSRVRGWAGLPVSRDPPCLIIAGALFEGLPIPEDAIRVTRKPGIAEASLIFPVGRGRFRIYFVFRHGTRKPLSGPESVSEFLASCVRTGASSEWFCDAILSGPIASFHGSESWVEHPYRENVVLIGDAAATSDPTFGCGLALTMRDVRVLHDDLVAESDWGRAAANYAAEHHRYYVALHRIEGWWRDFFYGTGPQADVIRARALPLIMEDPSRIPDIIGRGPDVPCDEEARRRFFGEA